MKYDLTQSLQEDRRLESTLNRMLIGTLSDPACPVTVNDLVAHRQATGQPITLDLTFTINGHEVDLAVWLGNLMTQFDHEVQRAARRLVKERFVQLDSQVGVIGDALQVAHQAVLREFGLPAEDE